MGVCWRCGQGGHFQRDCDQPSPAPAAADDQRSSTTRGAKGIDRASVYLKMELVGKALPCLLDSGCEISLVPESVVKKAKSVNVLPSTRRVWAANNTELLVTGEANLPLMLDGRCLRTFAIVTPDVEEVMLGADWLQTHNCLWDFRNGQLYIDGRAAVPLRRRRAIHCRRVFVQEDIVLSPRQQVDMPARTTILSLQQKGAGGVVESREIRSGVYIGRTLLPDRHRDVRVRVVNTTTKPQLVRGGTCLGNLCPVEVVENGADRSGSPSSKGQRLPSSAVGMEKDGADAQADVITALLDKLPDEVTEGQRSVVQNLLQSYDDVFSRGAFDMGRTSLVEHAIDTGDHRPIRQGLRRHPIAHLDVIDKQLDELLQNDFIEPAASPWASNVVLVRK